MKKRLLFIAGAHEWNKALAKFLKLQRRINGPEFTEVYSRQQRVRLIEKLRSLFRRLESMQHRVGLRLAGTAVALVFTATVASAQMGWAKPDTLVLNFGASKPNLTDVAFADLDEDGDLDLYAAANDGVLRVYKNDGYGEFPDVWEPVKADGENIDWAPYGFGTTFVDLDDDGDLDLLGASAFVDYINRYINQGLGIFFSDGVMKLANGDTLKTNTNARFAFADLDGDDDLDFYLGSPGNNSSIQVYENTGAMALTRVNDLQADGDTLFIPGNYTSPAFSDYDGDGDLDLFVGNAAHDQPIILYKNNSGVFGSVPDSLKTVEDSVIYFDNYANPVFADLDDDGVNELYTGGWGGNVWFTSFIDPTIGIKELTEDEHTLGLYPNPATSVIRFKTKEQLDEVKIYNITGGLVARFSHVRESIDISDLSDGVYMIEAIATDKTYIQKFIKQ